MKRIVELNYQLIYAYESALYLSTQKSDEPQGLRALTGRHSGGFVGCMIAFTVGLLACAIIPLFFFPLASILSNIRWVILGIGFAVGFPLGIYLLLATDLLYSIGSSEVIVRTLIEIHMQARAARLIDQYALILAARPAELDGAADLKSAMERLEKWSTRLRSLHGVLHLGLPPLILSALSLAGLDAMLGKVKTLPLIWTIPALIQVFGFVLPAFNRKRSIFKRSPHPRDSAQFKTIYELEAKLFEVSGLRAPKEFRLDLVLASSLGALGCWLAWRYYNIPSDQVAESGNLSLGLGVFLFFTICLILSARPKREIESLTNK